jgi:hypothetical protein
MVLTAARVTRATADNVDFIDILNSPSAGSAKPERPAQKFDDARWKPVREPLRKVQTRQAQAGTERPARQW